MAEKKRTKAGSKTRKKMFSKNKKNLIIYSSLGVLALIIILAAIIFTLPEADEEEEKTIVAYVKGFPIYEQELDNEYRRVAALLPPSAEASEVKKAVLFNLINEKLLVIEAESQGLKVTEEEIETRINSIIEQYEISQEQFYENLEQQGISREESRNRIREQMLISELIEQKDFYNITADEEEVQRYLEREYNKLEEKITTRHILVTFENRSEEEADLLIRQIKEEFEANNDRFCDLVEEYSEDMNTVQNCGLYDSEIFPMLAQEFQQAAKNNAEGEANIAKTDRGYHLIWTIDRIGLEEQAQEIATKEKQNKALEEFLQGLIEEADITNCLENPDSFVCTGEELPEKGSTMDRFAKCLTEKGARMYGAYWNTETGNQKEMFGTSFEHVDYVECANRHDPRFQDDECVFMDIEGYPTWIIDGEMYAGIQPLDILASLTGCTL